ncbi:NfeD family protein [Nocardia sp. CDC160]|uniref:NfeD family protein n=1 Tax=Nocardia sp. CDC160 TaxID=3112166 RepID=UPI002DC00647|nr:NfeD family protein [Nocardia sp. CDC160]MEC3917772.1 NfeD family protein [Nocardia sp. CDC160]
MAAIVWLVAGILLAAAEMLTGSLVLIMLGVAALVTAGVSAATGSSVVVDAVVFGGVSIALLVGVRPFLLRRYATPPPHQTGVDALPGRTAKVLEQVDEHGGRVKLGGEVWSARPYDASETYPVGSTVFIMRIDGAHAVVMKGP